MMLLTIVLAPLSLGVLFIVMSWTERALDHQLNCPAVECPALVEMQSRDEALQPR